MASKKPGKVAPNNAAPPTPPPKTVIPFWDNVKSGVLWEDLSPANPYDKVYLGGMEVPGISDVVSTNGRQNDIDVKKTKGKSGSSIKFNGAQLVELEVKVKIWMPRHVEMYQDLVKITDPGIAKKGLEPNVLSILHPKAVALGVTKVIAKSISDLTISEGGTGTFSIKLLQYEPPKGTKPSPKPPPDVFQGSNFDRTGAQQTKAERDATQPPSKGSASKVA